MNRRLAVTVLSDLANAAFAISACYTLACAFRLALGIQFGMLGVLATGFAAVGWVALAAARHFRPPRPPRRPLTVRLDTGDTRKLAEAVRAELAKHEWQVR